MENIFSIAITISIVYFFIKFFELKFKNDEEKKPLKNIIKESITVCISSIIGIYIFKQFTPMVGGGNGNSNTAAFIDNPDF
jgi:O-antigen/teichoic acid export membrane protein